jgi:hypothetical protein
MFLPLLPKYQAQLAELFVATGLFGVWPLAKIAQNTRYACAELKALTLNPSPTGEGL